MKNYLLLMALCLFMIPFGLKAQELGFLKAKGKQIVDANGNNVVLRGIGLGCYMIQEGYMMETSDFANRQTEIRSRIESLVGAEKTEIFYKTWRENYITEADVDSIKSWGFNSIRLPMHYNLFTLSIDEEPVEGEDTWIDTGFDLVDNLLSWCEKREIYLILDLHGAPGGQGKDAAISDYDSTKPSLWESPENQRKTVALWKKLAERYADEPWIGGYDLINEPNWDIDNAGNKNGCSCNQNTALWKLYKEIIAAIRTVDKNHLVVLSGNCWGNNYNGLSNIKSFDSCSNLALSFHRYWCYNNDSSISGILGLRNTLNIPIWMSESGENSNAWFADAVDLLEKNNVGWDWWPYKKLGSVSGMIIIPKPEGYSSLINSMKGSGTKISAEKAFSILMELTENMKIENCKILYDVLDALFRQPATDSVKPFADNEIPGRIFASNYDYGRSGIAYHDGDSANYNTSSGEYTTWNQGWAYRNDGVDIENCSDAITNGYDVGWLNQGEWMQYTVNVSQSGAYKCEVRYATNSASGRIGIYVDGKESSGSVSLPSTGSWTTWKSKTIENIILTKGTHAIKVKVEQTGFNLNYLNFSDPVAIENVVPKILNATTATDGSYIVLASNLEVKTAGAISDFTLKVDNADVEIVSTEIDPENPYGIRLNLAHNVYSHNKIKIAYSGTSMTSIYGTEHAAFSSMSVVNVAPVIHILPSKIEAEDYETVHGWQTESCTDVGEGVNLSYSGVGYYTEYRILVPKTGNYQFNYRVASNNSAGGKFSMSLVDGNKVEELHQVVMASTGGWQTWKTLSKVSELEEGDHLIRFKVISREFNLNWIEISNPTAVDDLEMGLSVPSIAYDRNSKNLLIANLKEEHLPFVVSIYDFSGRNIIKNTISTLVDSGEHRISVPELSGFNIVNICYPKESISKKIQF